MESPTLTGENAVLSREKTQGSLDSSSIFLDASGIVKSVVETMNLRPDLLNLSTFSLECLNARIFTRHASNTLRTEGVVSHPSAHDVSAEERAAYYNGIAGGNEHPDLLYRTGSDKYPWTTPTGRWAAYPTKSIYGVHGTSLNGVWNTVGPQIRDIVRSLKIRYAIDPARFVTHRTDKEDTLGPVVIWIGVNPGSTSADTAHEISLKIFELLESHAVKDVEVEWHEAISWKATGPPLLPVAASTSPIRHVGRHLTAALGMPISVPKSGVFDAQGSVGLFFHETRDANGDPSDKVFGVTSHHVLCEKKKEYTLNGPLRDVQLVGFRRFQKGLNEITQSIANSVIDAELRTWEIIELEKKVANQVDHDNDEAKKNAKYLLRERQNLDNQLEDIADLEKFYKEVIPEWVDTMQRTIGYVQYAPPLSVDVEGEGYTEDWGTFLVDQFKFKAHFEGNVVDLGSMILPSKFTSMLRSQDDSTPSFLYPTSGKMRINGIVTQEQLANPDLIDSKCQPCLIVLKDGCATDLTVGRYAGLHSFLCNEDGVESVELAIYNYDHQSGPFSAKGDSGSLIFDGHGRMVGLLHSGRSRSDHANSFVTYATPAWWLVERIKAKYPHADFDRTTW